MIGIGRYFVRRYLLTMYARLQLKAFLRTSRGGMAGPTAPQRKEGRARAIQGRVIAEIV